MKRAAGFCLLPLLIASCGSSDSVDIQRVLHAPGGRFVAVQSYANNGPMVSDDLRVRVYVVQHGKPVQPCWAYRGAYGHIGTLEWSESNRLLITYKSGVMAEIHTRCSFDDERGAPIDVEIVPQPILSETK